jgi:GEVED domain/Pregnancy-associated plasma protein-A
MNQKLPSLFLLVFLFFGCVKINAQNSPKCVYEPDTQTKEISRQIIEKMNFTSQKAGQSRAAALVGVVKLPLVVHVIESSTSTSLITDAQIATMVANLNAAYRATGAFTGSTDIEVEFELAKQDPTCAITNGITRYDASGNATYVSKGVFNTGVSWATVQGWKTWDKKLYTNIWIVNKLDNGAAGVGGPGDGFIVLANVAKTANEQVSPHEMAHYFGLNHPFPNDPTPNTSANCNCGDGDGLVDTPNLTAFAIGSTCQHEYGCSPAQMNSINPCTNAAYGIIQQNFMNYLQSSCGNKFTPNQKTFMRNFIESYHGSQLSSPVLQTTPITPAALLTVTPTFCTTSNAFPNIASSCLCSTISSFTATANGVLQQYPTGKPGLSVGQQTTYTYVLTCANSTTVTKTTVFYNPGVSGLQTVCGSGSVYSVTYNNPLNHVVTTTAGTVSGNSIINIPVGTNVTLTVSDASGCGGNQQTVVSPCCSSGPISVAACTPTISGGAGNSGITNFTFNTINASSDLANVEGNYIDKTCYHQTTVSAGASYPISITGFGFKQAFIDYNNNGVFTDAGENVVLYNLAGTYTGSVTVPTTATKGVALRMRVKSDNAGGSASPCTLGSGSSSGQIEDFAVIIESIISSVQTGAWEANTTWDLMRIPIAGDKIIISPNHVVTINNANAVGKNIECKATSRLIFNVATPKSKLALGL